MPSKLRRIDQKTKRKRWKILKRKNICRRTKIVWGLEKRKTKFEKEASYRRDDRIFQRGSGLSGCGRDA